jgi:hypothetical protein
MERFATNLRNGCNNSDAAVSRAAMVIGVAAAIGVGVALSARTTSAPVRIRTARAGACGVERWTVKTLQDRPQLLPAHSSTVRALGRIARPSSLPASRLPQERHVYTVTAQVVRIRAESDGDFHAVLSAGGRTLIAEAPNSTCTGRATQLRRSQMEKARKALRLCHARATGVLLFDFPHGQSGHAPNYVELHPLLGFACA